MALVAAAFAGNVQLGTNALRLGALRNETHSDRVVHVVTAPKHLWPLLRRLKQVAQRWHRSIVQIRSPEPDAVEKHGVVAREVLLDQSRALDAHTAHDLVGRNGCLLTP